MIPLIACLAWSAAACSTAMAVAAEHPDEGAGHAAVCGPVAYGTNPPSSGTHFGVWAQYKTYASPVPAGFLVHSLEHGAVVIGYRCPGGCPEEVAAVQAFIDGLPGDPVCGGARPKVVLAPDSALDVRWAASAWTWTWKAPCPDTASLGEFYRAHYGRTAEAAVCGGGVDYGARGWCPVSLIEPRRGPEGDPERVSAGRALWRGSLPKSTRLFLDLSRADGSRLGTLDLGEAGPGAASAAWTLDLLGKARDMAGRGTPMLLRLRTGEGRELARRLAVP